MRERPTPVHQERRSRLTDWRHWLESSTGVLYLIWYVRFGMLVWLWIFYLVRGHALRNADAFLGLLIAFLIYIGVSGGLGLRNPERSAGRYVKLAQTVVEIACYLAFYYLTHDLRSGMYFLLFAPLFVAMRFLPLAWSLGVLAGTMAGLAGVGIALSTDFLAWDVLTIMIPREVLLVAMAAFYLVRQHTDVLSQVSEDDSPLRNALGGLEDGVYVTDREKRLLFVNESLQARHGPFTPFQTCASYFGCAGAQCGLEFAGEEADPAGDGRRREAVFTDRAGRAYPVEISSTLLQAEEESGYSGAISLVRDVSVQRAFERRLLADLARWSSRLIAHTEQQALYDACVQGGAAIFDVEDCSLMLLNEDGTAVDLVASSGVPPHVWSGRQMRVDGPGLTAHVVRTGETLNFGDNEYRQHPAWGGHAGPPFTAHLDYLPSRRCHSVMSTPIVDRSGRPIGVLKVENRRGPGAGRRFPEYEVTIFQTYASQVGLAIERARLYARLDEEAERRTRESIADEVHESLSLVHGLIHLKTGLARALLERGDYAGVREQLDMIAKGALSLKADLRSTYMEVRHPALEEGLVSALQRAAESLGLKLAISVQGREPLAYPVEHALYKIGQEALNNARRHAGLGPEDAVEVMLSRASTGYELRIRDGGRGFDAEAVRLHPEAFGLQAMERRARSINAQLEITSAPGAGTQVRVYGRWPSAAP